MAINSSTFMYDLFEFIKTDLLANINDPIANKRDGTSAFIMTSYPQKAVMYPLVTIKCKNVVAKRAGMQTTAMDMSFIVEIRVWATNEKQKETIFTEVLNRLRNIQFTTSTGSHAVGLHDYNVLSSVEIDEPGEQGIKSRVMELQYNYFNIA